MKLWIISQTQNNNYDTFDSAVVAAETEDQARNTVPGGEEWGYKHSSWAATPDQVKVELLGIAEPHIEAGVVLGSFNAG